MTEEWRSVSGYEGFYEVSNIGNVRSLKDRFCNPRMKILKLRKHSGGYVRASLCYYDSSKPKDYYVHSLVMRAFVGERPIGLFINHINGVKSDNRIENLEYVTPSQNSYHAANNGLAPVGSKHKNSKLNEAIVREIRENKDDLGPYQLACKYGVCHGTMRRLLQGITWRHVN